MNNHHPHTKNLSLWQAQAGDAPSFPALGHDIDADICVIGAGIAGLSVAYDLLRKGLSVAVVDAGTLLGGETGHTTAHITATLDDGFCYTEKIFGTEKARLVIASHKAAIDRIETIIRNEKIACDFERLPSYLVALNNKEKKLLLSETRAAERLGFADLEILPRAPSFTTMDNAQSVIFPEQATLNMTKYLDGLATACQSQGAQIYLNTRITRLEKGPAPAAITESGHHIRARSIVIATHFPPEGWTSAALNQTAYTSYVLAFEVAKDRYPGFLLCDLNEPYHYASRIQGNDVDYLLIGGTDHKAADKVDEKAHYSYLENWAMRLFPDLGRIAYRWSGTIMEPGDTLAYIGRAPGEQNIYLVTGDSGNGITHAAIAGMLITDLVQGQWNPAEAL